MKYIFPVAALVVLLAFSAFRAVEHTLADAKFKGKVKTVREFAYKPVIQFDEITPGRCLDSAVSTFNEGGFITQLSHFGKQSDNIYRANKSYRNVFKYNERNQRTEELYYDEYGKLAKKRVLKYDSAGNKLDVSQYDAANALQLKEKFKYNAAGQCIQYNRYRGNGERIVREWYFYNSIGQRVKQASVDASNKLIEETIYVYNSHGDTLQATTYNSSVQSWSSQVSRVRNVYDVNWKLSRTKWYYSPWQSPENIPTLYDDKGRLLREECEYTYDKNNNILTSTLMTKGVLTARETYKEGLLEKRTTYDKGTPSVAYSFDTFGNLTSCLYYFSSGGTSVEEYTYDDSGRPIKLTNTYSRDEYKYDEYDRLVQINRYSKSDNRLSVRTVFSYPGDSWKPSSRTVTSFDNGKVDASQVRAITYDDDIAVDGYLWGRELGFLCQSSAQYKWDQHDNLLEVKKVFPGSSDTQTYSYTYDAQGNWTKKSHFHQPATTPDRVTERIYEYFP